MLLYSHFISVHWHTSKATLFTSWSYRYRHYTSTVVIANWLTVTRHIFLKRQWIFSLLRRSLSPSTDKTFTRNISWLLGMCFFYYFITSRNQKLQFNDFAWRRLLEVIRDVIMWALSWPFTCNVIGHIVLNFGHGRTFIH